MNRSKYLLLLALLCGLAAGVSPVLAQGTAFTYQGQLTASNGPATGNYDFVFSSFTTSNGVVNNGGPVTNLFTPVSNGLFTTTVDFGAGAFTGAGNWLQIAVRTNNATNTGSSNFVTLSPRQLITPSPYAIAAEGIVGGGGSLTGLNASQLSSGTVPNARLPADVALLDVNETFVGTNVFATNTGFGTATPAFPVSFPTTNGDLIGLSSGPGNHFGIGTQPSLLQIYTADSTGAINFGYGSSAAMTETMRIQGNGNVGIGTPTPGALLDVHGNFQVNANGTVESVGTANNFGSFNGLIESRYASGDRYGLAQLSNGITALYDSSTFPSSSLQLGQMTGSAGFTPQLTVDHSGNLSSVGNIAASNSITAFGSINSSNNITAGGNITASGKFTGDGSGLFNVSATIPPPNPRQVALLKWGVSSLDNSVTVGTTPRAICFDGANIWVANSASGNVTEINASTAGSIGNFTAGTGPDGICFDGAFVWVADNNGTVTKLNANTGVSAGNFGAGTIPAAACFDGASIWVANFGGGNVTKLNAGTGALINTYAVSSGPCALCFDGSSIWIANSNSTVVSKLDAATGTGLGNFTVGANPVAVCFDGSNIWVANFGGNSVTKLDPSTGNSLGTFTVGTNPDAICFDGVNIWVANYTSGNVMKLAPRTGAVLGTYTAGTNPNAICFDGASIWVVNVGGTVKKL